MAKDAAGKLFRQGFNCAQSVLASQSGKTGLPVPDSLKLATGFGAGMALMQKTCGAVTGAYMAIGARYGRMSPDDQEARDRVYSLIGEFNLRFMEKFGSLECRELIGVDLKTEEGANEAEEGGYFEKKCGAYVAEAEKILSKLM